MTLSEWQLNGKGMRKMIRIELHKLFKRRLVWVVFCGIIFLIIVSCLWFNSYYFDGENIRSLQKEISVYEKHKGTLTDERLEGFLKDYTIRKYDYIRELFVDEEGQRRSVDEVYSRCVFPIQFGYFEGWLFFLDELPKYIKYIPVFIVVAFSALFTYERECSMQEILLCTKRGREQCVRAKVAGAFLLTNALWIFALVPTGILYFIRYRGIGWDTSIQMTLWLKDSQLQMNYGTLFIHMVFLSLIVINVILLFTLIVSYHVKNPMTAMCIVLGALFFLRPDMMSVILSDNAVADRITALTPVNVLDTVNLAKQLPVSAGGVKLQWLTVAEVLYAVLLVVCAFFFLRIMGKRQKYDAA